MLTVQLILVFGDGAEVVGGVAAIVANIPYPLAVYVVVAVQFVY